MDRTKGDSKDAHRDLRRWTPTIVSLVGALTICLAFGVPQLVSAAGGSGSVFTPVGPTRVLDSRTGLGTRVAGKVPAGGTVVVRGLSGARALAVNITVTEPDAAGFITAWPGGARPNSSAVNYEGGQTVANSAIVPTDPNGNFTLFTMTGTHLIVDVTGSFDEIPGGSAPITGAINATVTHYAPAFGSTDVSGTVVNGTNETITIAIDLQAASGESKTTFADNVAPGQTAAWDTFFSGEFTTGVSVLRAYKAF